MSNRIFRFEDERLKNEFLNIISYRIGRLSYKGDVINTNFIKLSPLLRLIVAIPKDRMRGLSSTLVTEDLVASMQIIQDIDVLSALLFSQPSGCAYL